MRKREIDREREREKRDRWRGGEGVRKGIYPNIEYCKFSHLFMIVYIILNINICMY